MTILVIFGRLRLFGLITGFLNEFSDFFPGGKIVGLRFLQVFQIPQLFEVSLPQHGVIAPLFALVVKQRVVFDPAQRLEELAALVATKLFVIQMDLSVMSDENHPVAVFPIALGTIECFLVKVLDVSIEPGARIDFRL